MVGPVLSAVNARVGRRALIWAAALAVLALALDFVPLFDLLGYDFAFALGLGTALASVDIGQGAVARFRKQHPEPAGWATLLKLAAQATWITLAALVLPLLLSLANALRVRNCNLGAGLAFFALLPIGTALYAAPAGVLAGLAVPARRPRLGRLLAFALPVASIVWTLLRLYRYPPVFAYDPFGGYFPGPIYDEALRPPLPLLVFRLLNLVWIAAALAAGAVVVGRGLHPRRWRLGAALVALPLVAASAVLFAQQGRMGIFVRRPDLERALDRTLRTEHFVLHYATAATLTPAEVALTAEDLEFRYQQLVQTLGVEPRLPITAWEFPTPELKKELVGAGHTLFARPWTQEIFLHAERFPSGRLRHEMAHVFASAFGDRFFGVSLAWRGPLPTLAIGMIEGLAEAADASDPDGETTLHQDAAAMVEDGRAPPLAAVMGAGFSAQAGARAYTVAGSFVTFLLETRGAEKLRALYRSAGDFQGVYGESLASLEAQWRAFLRRQPLSERDRARAHERFRRPAIFAKVCARELAARLALARAVEHEEPERAVRLLEDNCRDDPHEPIFRLELAQALALGGERRRALDLLGRMGADADVTRPVRAQAASLAAEIHFHARDYTNATASEARVLELATDDADRRQAFARGKALESPGARDTLGRAMFGPELGTAGADPVLTFFRMLEYARLFPTEKLGPYMVGRQLLTRDPAAALPYLARACGEPRPGEPEGGTPLPPEVVRECLRMTAEAGYRVGDFPRARTALAALVASSRGEADRLRATDFLARVDWAATRRRGPVGETSGGVVQRREQ
jgi:hypothetical protein